MASPSKAPLPDAPSPDEVRLALARILESPTFVRAPRLCQFLRYVVEQSLEDGGETLKEYSIAVDVFGRPPTFDPRLDTIVRVQARRLRQRLGEYYANEGGAEPIRIAIPVGGYAPVFRAAQSSKDDRPAEKNPASPHARDPGPAVDRRAGMVALGVAGALLAVVGVALYKGTESSPQRAEWPSQGRPLTTLGGQELQPDLSPDGEMAVFVWRDTSSGKHDLYLKSIGGSALVQLTRDPGLECCPAWAPDGETVAFLRPIDGGSELVLIPSGGGQERRLAKLSVEGKQISWSPDGRFVAVEDGGGPSEPAGIFLVSSESGHRTRITTADNAMDHYPAFSPRGDALAFARGASDYGVYVVRIDASGSPVGKPRRVTAASYYVGGLDWALDGSALVFSVYPESDWWRLWTVESETESGRARPLDLEGFQAAAGTRAGVGRMVYVAHSEDMNLYRIPGPAAPKGSDRSLQRIVDSSRTDTAPNLSPDGERLAFISGSSGSLELFVAENDGSNAVQLTDFPGALPGSPRWSQDGHRIAFNVDNDGHHDVYTIALAAGLPKRITTARSRDGGASWSAGDRWLYFMSDRDGGPAIWKVPGGGGYPERVTEGRGYQAIEAWDGEWLYFTKRFGSEGESGIFRMPVGGGAEERVMEEGEFGRWALSRTSIYLLRSRSGDRPAAIERYLLDNWEPQTVMEFPAGTRFGMANNITVSADDRWIVFAQYDHAEADLMVADFPQ